MMLFFKSETKSKKAPAKPAPTPRTGFRERTKGVLHGRAAFRFEVTPPLIDRLSSPVHLNELPVSPPPREGIASRIQRFFSDKTQKRNHRLLWQYFDIIQDTLERAAPGLSSPSRFSHFSRFGQPPSTIKTSKSRGITHPYQFQSAFELLPKLPEAMATERRYLNELLVLILKVYHESISKRTVGSLTFHTEAQEYFFTGYRMEKTIHTNDESEEAFSACQTVYDSYHHGINYYMYSLLLGEAMDEDNQLFLFFCNALYFRSRISWNGILLDRPNIRNLPSRQWALSHAFRDISAIKQFKNNATYAAQFRTILRAFPELKTLKELTMQ